MLKIKKRLLLISLFGLVVILSGCFLTGNTPVITFVTSIQPVQTQNIIIYGSGFGTAQPYTDQDSQYISVDDETAGWQAGYAPDNNAVTLDIGEWTDTQIVITGFDGAYGWSNWLLNPGDEILISVWNTQTDTGPATYITTVQ